MESETQPPDASLRSARNSWELFVLAILAAALIFSVASVLVAPPAPPLVGGFELDFQGRYVVGMAQWLETLGQGALTPRQDLIASVEGLELSGGQRFCLLPLFLELKARDRALAVAEATRKAEPELSATIDDLLEDRPLDKADAEALKTRCAFVGELAVADEAGKTELRLAARRFSLFLLAAFVAMLGAVGVGAVLLFFGWYRRSEGRLRSRYPDDVADIDGDPIPYLETLTFFLVLLICLSAVAALVVGGDGLLPLLLNWLAVPIVLWPLLRGKSFGELRRVLGWHRGAGFWREVGSGLVGYLAALPILGLAFLASVTMGRIFEQTPSHPIVEWVRNSSPFGLALAASLALIWAPLLEESVFRGAFFHYVRRRLPPLAASLVVGAIFAMIHPQGLAALPFLTTLAVVLAMIREWRGSLIASITVHMVHNGLAFLLMLVILR